MIILKFNLTLAGQNFTCPPKLPKLLYRKTLNFLSKRKMYFKVIIWMIENLKVYFENLKFCCYFNIEERRLYLFLSINLNY